MKHQFDEHLLDCFELFTDSRIKDAMEYSLFASSKRVRPLLLLALLKDYGCDPYLGLDAAAALEMVHTYSLIHDDLPAMDNDDYRRGQLTSHRQFDEATAILAGDSLLTGAFEILAASNLRPEKKSKCLQILAHHSGANGMILGQILDIEYERAPDLNFDQLREMYRLKTGMMIAAALEMACVIAQKEDEQFTVRKIGETLGVAFQVQDDILDVSKTTEELGKSANSDIANHKTTAVSLLGMEEAQSMVTAMYKEIQNDLNHLSLGGNEVYSFIDYLMSRQV